MIVPPSQPVRLNNIGTFTEQPRPVASSFRTVAYYEVEIDLYKRLCFVLLCTVLLAFFGTPLTLFATIPSLYCVCKVRI